MTPMHVCSRPVNGLGVAAAANGIKVEQASKSQAGFLCATSREPKSAFGNARQGSLTVVTRTVSRYVAQGTDGYNVELNHHRMQCRIDVADSQVSRRVTAWTWILHVVCEASFTLLAAFSESLVGGI